MTHFKGRDIVSIDHFTTDELVWILDYTKKFKDAKKTREYSKRLNDYVMAYAFFEPSTRTRLSFMRASHKQGMDRFGFGSAESTSLQKNESMHHTVEMLRQYEADVLVIRHKLEGAAQYAADLLDIPVINAGDGRHEHPTQTILDLYSIMETQGRLDNLNVALIGDLKNGRTVHSLIKALRRFPGNRFFLVSPPQLSMPPEYVYAEAEGHPMLEDIVFCSTPEEALREADVGYVTRVQKERIEDERERKAVLGSLQVKQSTLAKVKPNLKLLHPLPIDALNPEIEKTLYRTHPQHVYFFPQSGNGLYSREVDLCIVVGALGDDFKGEGYLPPVRSRENVLLSRELKSDGDTKDRKFLYSINDGVVVDHIPPGQIIQVYTALHLDRLQNEMIFGDKMGTNRSGMDRKGLLKIVNYRLTPEELRTLAILCPTATVSMISDSKVVEKYNVQLPDAVDGLLECQNDSCISRSSGEDAFPRFYTISRNPAILSCHYCDTRHSLERGNIKII